MASSLDALEALLQFRRGRAAPAPQSLSPQPLLPVPNPLDPAQPHFIEGDAPTCVSQRRAFCGRAFSSAVAVPDPLAKPTAPRLPVHDRGLSSPTSTSATASNTTNPLEGEVRRRGKRRRRHNDAERLKLTRHRNRTYAKSTRLKKKKRLQALLATEAKYLRLQEKLALEQRRTDSLFHCVKNLDNASKDLEVKQLVGQDTVSLADNSGMIKVLASELPGVLCASFVPGTADISALSFYWSSPKSISSLAAGTSLSATVLSLKA